MNIEETLNLVKEVYKKTLAYELEKVTFDKNGNPKHYHSDKFLDEHPERKDSPEYTNEEENELLKFMWAAANLF